MSARSRRCASTAFAGIILLAASAGAASAQEASDSIATATEIPGLPFAAQTDVAGATTSADEPVPDCMFAGGLGSDSVWYRYTANQNGPLAADALGSTYDTVMVVWDGAPGGVAAGCNDDFYGLQSSVTFTGQTGHTYYIQVASWRAYDPTLDPPPVLDLRLAPPPPPFAATVTMDSIGRAAGATGVVEIAGTVTCNRPGFVSATVYVEQQHGRIAASGLFLQGPCGPTPERATGRFVGQNARFTPGQASVTVVGNGFADNDPFSSAPIFATTALRLQGASPKSLVIPPPPAP